VPGRSGEIDYRLARRSRINAFRKGRLSRHDVCDAHPDLVRAARNVGEPTDERCPICDEADLVHVSYVFGPRMPSSGRCVTSAAELRKVARGVGQAKSDLACYVVEVCPVCSWNHLARVFLVAPGRRRAAPKSTSASR
jgi:Family of unknown function (DUF5318)